MPDNRYLDAFAVLDPGLLSPVRQQPSANPANQYGFPQPTEQFPSPAAATTKYYFADETKWRAILEYGDFDDIVVGSGFCALAYIDKALQLDPKRRILVLERGGLWLMTHFQNLPLPFNLLLNNVSETYPWGLTSSTFHSDIKFVYGCFPFFGGRSPFWSAWSPRPPLGLLRNFPKSLLATAGEEQFWKDCRELLNVVEPDQLFGGDYQALQQYLGEQLNKAVLAEEKPIDTVSYAEPANLAVAKTTGVSKLAFEKFSTPGPLLKLYERQRRLAKTGEGSPITIATDVVLERFETDPLDPGKRTNVLHTSRGTLSFTLPKKPNIILATGAIPACTIVLNSVAKQHGRAGSRLGGQFLCHINARFPLPEKFRTLRKEEWDKRKKTDGKGAEQILNEALEIGAYYLAGRDPASGLQYHGEITAIHSPLAEELQEDAARLCPDFFSAPSAVQLEGSKHYVIVACVMYGEIDETNSDCQIRFNKERTNKTTNIDLQLAFSEREKKLREVMYKTALQTINAVAGAEARGVEYWHDDGHGAGQWDKSEPDKTQFQVNGVVHETSTLYMDDTLPLHPNLEPEVDSPSPSKPSVDRNYRVYGTGNVYATGSAIFPSSGSWNPTLTICGFAQDLAIKLHRLSVFRQVFSVSIASSQLYHFMGTTENLLNALRRRVGETLTHLNPKGLLSGQRGMWQLNWGPVVWKNGSDTGSTGPDLSWYVVYHDNLEFEDGSLHPTYVIAVAGTPTKSTNKLVDLNAFVYDGQFKTQPTEVSIESLDRNKAYIALPTAQAVQSLLTSPAPSVAGVRTLLNFIHGVKSTKDPTTRVLPRFIFTGHSVGGAIASSLALSLVLGGIIPPERTLTYSTAGPSPGNATFVNLFERTFKARVTTGVDAFRSWNINLINTLDVVLHPWYRQRFASPNNIPAIYVTPIVPDATRISDTQIGGTSDSGVEFKPLPNRYFTSTAPSAPPACQDDFLRMAVQQHVQAYLREVGVFVPEYDFSRDGLVAKTEADIRLNYPVIDDLERAYRGEDGTRNGTGMSNGTFTRVWASPASDAIGSRTWAGTRNGAVNGTGTDTGTTSRVGIINGPGAEPTIKPWTETGNGTVKGSGTNSGTVMTGNGAGVGAGTCAVSITVNEAETETRNGAGGVAVTPLSSITVLKYGNPEYNLIPQSVQNHPLLVYRNCFPDSTSVAVVKSHLQSIAVVDPHRTGTLLIRDHFYANTHKVLCITTGQAQLRFGGESNPDRVDVEVKKGDVVIIPAGVPHRLLKDMGRDLEAVESYPKGTNVDADSRRLGSRPQQTHLYSIAALGWFTRDPIYGDQGPVLGC